MQSKKLSIGPTVALAMFTVAALMPATRAAAQQEGVLHNFNRVSDTCEAQLL